MTTVLPLMLLAAGAVGVDAGWTEREEGGYEYILQLSPEEVESLRAGSAFGGDLPDQNGAIRSVKIVVGRGPVKNHGVPLPAETVVAMKPAGDAVSAEKVQTGGAAPSNAGGDRLRPVDPFGPPRGPRTAAEEEVTEISPLPDPPSDPALIRSLRDGRNGSQKVAAETQDPRNFSEFGRSDEEADDSKATSDEDNADEAGPTSEESAADTVDPDKFEVSKFWYFTAWILLFIVGGMFGWVSFLAIEFRNRYLELLRDLDTPAEEPVNESRESRRYEEEAAEEEEQEEETHEPEELIPSSTRYGNGRHSQHRRRDRRDEDYEDE